MEIQTFNRKDLVERKWTTAQIKALPHVALAKAMKDGKPSKGRPSKLYSAEVVFAAEAERAATVTVPAVSETVVETVNEPVAVAA